MGKAIKIPMMVQALVIDKPTVSGKTPMASPAPAVSPAPAPATKGSTSSTLSTSPASSSATQVAPAASPAPAGSATTLEAGVHLSWALPDCLMRATVAEATSGNVSAGDTVFQELPDTWLILRFNAPVAGAKRTYRAWVLDAWKGAATPIASFKANTSSAVAGLKLTPLGFMNATGDIVAPPYPTTRPTSLPGCGPEAFSGFYPIARDRFGFCDPLDDNPTGPLSYLVCGWYSQLARDPLYAAGSDTARLDLLERLELEMDGVLLVALDGAKLPAGTLPPSATLPPDHMVVHGMLADVKVAGVGGSLQPTQSPMPDPTAVDFTLGDSASDAFSGLIAELDERRWILRIIQSKGYRGLQTVDAVGRIQADLHAQGFTARTGLNLKEARQALAEDPAWKPALDYLTSTDKTVYTATAAQMDKVVMEKSTTTSTGKQSSTTAPAESGKTSGSTTTTTTTATTYKSVLTNPSTLKGMGAGGQPVGERTRYFAANAPILMFSNAGRSYRYGHDGRMHPEGLLSCRIQGSNVVKVDIQTKVNGQNYAATITGVDLVMPGPELGTLDGAVQELILEAPLLDPTSAPQVRGIILAARPTTDTTLINGLELAWKVETTFWWLSALPNVNPAEVAGYSKITGNLPSPLAISPWSDPWGTFYVDYAGRFAPTVGPLDQSWTLQAVEHVSNATLNGKGNTSTLSTAVNFSGRVLVSDGAPRALAASLRRLTNDPDLKNALGTTVDELNAQADQLDSLNVVSCELTALDPALKAAGQAVRAGALALDSVTLVDAFGRNVVLDPNRLKVPADAVQQVSFGSSGKGSTATNARGIVMPPRLLRSSRLDMRFLNAKVDNKQATTTEGPVCGWLVPDFIDGSLEVFDETGLSLGQLRLDTQNAVGFYWDPAPGTEAFSAERMSPTIANANLKRVVQTLLDAGQKVRGSQTSVLTGLLALLDAVRGTVDRKGDGDEFLALLLGTPIAVVRAKLSLEAEPTAEELVRAAVIGRGGSNVSMPAAPAAPAWPGGLKTRLGVLDQLDDGLLGYFLDDDGNVQTPVSGDAVIASPGLGVNQAVSSLPGVKAGAMLETAPGVTRNVTLLMTPGAGVHVTAGLLPQKRLDLTREWVKAGLERLAPTFSFGPLLVDPLQLRLPVPGAERFEWEWVSRTRLPSGVDGWQEANVTRADDSAVLPSAPVLVQDGWLKLTRG